jgi:hypothetical protein
MKRTFLIVALILGNISVQAAMDPQDTPVALTLTTNSGKFISTNGGRAVTHYIHRRRHHHKRKDVR